MLSHPTRVPGLAPLTCAVSDVQPSFEAETESQRLRSGRVFARIQRSLLEAGALAAVSYRIKYFSDKDMRGKHAKALAKEVNYGRYRHQQPRLTSSSIPRRLLQFTPPQIFTKMYKVAQSIHLHERLLLALQFTMKIPARLPDDCRGMIRKRSDPFSSLHK